MRIILSRHGESQYNVEDRIGGDSCLTARGLEYAQNLNRYIGFNLGWFPQKCISSTKMRVRQTINELNFLGDISICDALNEIDAGKFEDMTFSQFKKDYPEEAAKRKTDKLNYRYPNGESYTDIINRVKPIVDSIDSDILIVCHTAICRALISHFTDIPISDIPRLEIPLHTLIFIEDNQISQKVEL